MKFINESEIWLVDLEPTKGIEIQKIRPCVVLRKFSKDHFIVLPMTSQLKLGKASFLLENISFLKKEVNVVNLSQVRCVDRSRFLRRFGQLGKKTFENLKNKTAEVLKLLPQGASAHNVNSS